jgi:lipoate-protein ligase A
MISHGTLLFNTDLGEVANALQVKMSKIISKGHKSVRSRVANISEFITKPLKIADFRALLLRGLYEEMKPFETYHLTAEEWKAVHSLKEEKYDSWDWNYGRSPKFNIQHSKRFPVGEIDVRLFVEKGYLTGLKIFGDFFSQKPIENLENILIGVKYEKEEISNKLNGVKIEEYFGNVSTLEFIELLFSTDS